MDEREAVDRLKKGSTSVTVDRLESLPGAGAARTVDPKTIRGPWTFEFEAPDP